jgi:hypothetical protein
MRDISSCKYADSGQRDLHCVEADNNHTLSGTGDKRLDDGILL